MDGQRYYIYENGVVRPVSRPLWEYWKDENTKRLKVRETHFFRHGTSKFLGEVLTYFSGVDTSPETDEPCLWRTNFLGGARFEAMKHTSEAKAREQHDVYVNWIISMLRKEGFRLLVIEIDLSKVTKEQTWTQG